MNKQNVFDVGFSKVTSLTYPNTFVQVAYANFTALQVANRDSASWKKSHIIEIDSALSAKSIDKLTDVWANLGWEGQYLLFRDEQNWYKLLDFQSNTIIEGLETDILNYLPSLLDTDWIEFVNKKNKFNTHQAEYPIQTIFYGAPGTGKSNKIKKELENVSKENIFRTTFHPDSDYSSFVGAYKPTMKHLPVRNSSGLLVRTNGSTIALDNGSEDIIREEQITYNFVPQVFLKAYMQAYKTSENVYLVIEEINRGNCAQIFGDLFQLLDRDKDGKSEYSIKADEDLKAYLEKEIGSDSEAIKEGELCLPPNLFIWATMNTSDQSLFPIDSAFKRRWEWKYSPIKNEKERTIVIGENRYSWLSFQRVVNAKIFGINSSEDKLLGDYFVNPSDGIITKDVLLDKVLFYLWNDVCKDGEGDIFKTDSNTDVSFSALHRSDGTQKMIMMMNYLGVDEISMANEPNEEEMVDDGFEGDEVQDSSTRAWYQSLWSDVISRLQNSDIDSFSKPTTRTYYELRFGVGGVYVLTGVSKQKGTCYVSYYTGRRYADAMYPKLLAIKDSIEDSLGELEWHREDGKYGIVKTTKRFDDLNKEENRNSLIEWFAETMPKFYSTLSQHIKELR